MTRANLNFTYREKGDLKVLYYYQNGDQYPMGIREHYHVSELLAEFTPDGFKKWIARNYTNDPGSKDQPDFIISNGQIESKDNSKEIAKTRELDHTIIGDLTDYTYVFNDMSWTGKATKDGKPFNENTVQVFNWDEQIFNGTVTEFDKWIKEQE